jgi:hypothetical protein
MECTQLVESNTNDGSIRSLPSSNNVIRYDGFLRRIFPADSLTDVAPPIPFHNPSQDPFTDVSRNTSTNTSEAVQTQQTINLSDFTESLSMTDDSFTGYDTFDTLPGQLEDPPPEGDINSQYNYFNTLADNQDPSGY